MLISDTALLCVSTLSFRCWPERMFNLLGYSFRIKCKEIFFFRALIFLKSAYRISIHIELPKMERQIKSLHVALITLKYPKLSYRIKMKKERNILHTIKRRKTNWIGNILRSNCLLKYCIEERIQEAERQRR